LKLQGQQAFQLLLILVGSLLDTREDRLLETEVIRGVLRVETPFFDKLPEALAQVKSGRVGGQKESRDAETLGHTLSQCTPLRAGSVEHDGDRHPTMPPCQKPQELTDGLGRDGGQRRDGEDVPRCGVQRRQYIAALPPTGRFDTEAFTTPHQSQKRGKDKVGGIQKADDPLRRFGFCSARFELLGCAGFLGGAIGFGRDVANVAQLHA